jgi:hypothetical protein
MTQLTGRSRGFRGWVRSSKRWNRAL